MSEDTNDAEAAEPAEPAKAWQPSLKPQHRLGNVAPRAAIVEHSGRGGAFAALRAWLARPLVKVGLAVAAFIFGAIVYDATLNLDSWTIRAEKAKAGEHKGVRRTPR